jgi:DNA-binding transcriptional MocR family regulator
VLVSPGQLYFPSQSSGAWIRLSISLLDDDQIQEGVRRMACALARLHRG